MGIQLRYDLRKEGNMFVISVEKFGIATQGKTEKEAIANLIEAATLCFEDPDWRRIHKVSYSDSRESQVLSDVPQITQDLGKRIGTLVLQSTRA